MSKTYQPIHSSNPEERFVVEKNTREPIVNYEQWEGMSMQNRARDYSKWENEKMYDFDKYFKSRPKYPFPALPADCPDEMVEGRDFELQYQESYHHCNFNNWHNVSRPAHDEIFESTSIVHRRIIAVPLSVKSGEESKKEDAIAAAQEYAAKWKFMYPDAKEDYLLGLRDGYIASTTPTKSDEVERLKAENETAKQLITKYKPTTP